MIGFATMHHKQKENCPPKRTYDEYVRLAIIAVRIPAPPAAAAPFAANICCSAPQMQLPPWRTWTHNYPCPMFGAFAESARWIMVNYSPRSECGAGGCHHIERRRRRACHAHRCDGSLRCKCTQLFMRHRASSVRERACGLFNGVWNACHTQRRFVRANCMPVGRTAFVMTELCMRNTRGLWGGWYLCTENWTSPVNVAIGMRFDIRNLYSSFSLAQTALVCMLAPAVP